jgi:drug/metabolite transporter (DMT)-like permease
MTLSALLRLAVLVFVAVSFVVLGDTAGKVLTGAGVAPAIVAWTRFAIAALILLPFAGRQPGDLRNLMRWEVVVRAVLVAGGIFSILTALKTEPIANVFGAFFVGPIFSYILAVLFLGERPTRAQALLLCTGLIGVLLVVKPGFGATPGIGFAVLAGLFYGAFLAVTRKVAGAVRPRLLLVSQLVIGAIVLTPVGLTAPVPPLDAWTLGLLTASALASALGNYLLVLANRIGEASLIAPLIYTQLITATAIGILVFGDVPDMVALTGLALILASGLGSLWARRQRPL